MKARMLTLIHRYAAWNLFGWVYAYFFLPETKNLTLEELDTVFNVGNRAHSKYYTEKLPWYVGKYILRKDVRPMEPLYQFFDEDADEKRNGHGHVAKA